MCRTETDEQIARRPIGKATEYLLAGIAGIAVGHVVINSLSRRPLSIAYVCLMSIGFAWVFLARLTHRRIKRARVFASRKYYECELLRTSPLERAIASHKSWKNTAVGLIAVGLGIITYPTLYVAERKHLRQVDYT